MDNLCDPVGPVVTGTGELIHTGRIYSHSSGGGRGGTADPAAFGSPASALTGEDPEQIQAFGQHIRELDLQGGSIETISYRTDVQFGCAG